MPHSLLKPILISFGIVSAVALLLRISIASADYMPAVSTSHETYDLPNLQFGWNNVGSDSQAIQSVLATNNKASGFRVRMAKNTECPVSGAKFMLCSAKECVANEATMMASVEMSQGICNALLPDTDPTEIEIDFGSNVTLATGTTYYIAVKGLDYNSGNWAYISRDNAGGYADGTLWSYRSQSGTYHDLGDDAFFQLLYLEEYDPSRDVSILAPELADMDYQALLLRDSYFCEAATSTDCSIDFKYNFHALGSYVNFYLYSPADDNVEGGILATSSTLTENILMSATTSLAFQSAWNDKKKYYCAHLIDPDYEQQNRLFCGWSVSWLSEAELQRQRAIAGFTYNIDDACSDMDDTASSTFLYGFECGARKLVYWAMQPSVDTQIRYLDLTSKFMNTFPMNVYSQLKDNVVGLSTDASNATSSDFRLPLYWAGEDTGVDLLNETMLEDSPVAGAWENFNTVASYFIYFLTFMYMLNYFTAQKNDN